MVKFEPSQTDLGWVLVGATSRSRVSICNQSHCTLRYRLMPECESSDGINDSELSVCL